MPYHGEEVFFHWANRDQHYVKTIERFRDYAFKVRDLTGEYRVRFTMTEASVPKDDTKGNRRYFFPRPDLITYDEKARELVLPFEYRPPTSEEIEHYSKNNEAQEAILQEALLQILEAAPNDNLRALLQEDQRTEKDIAEDKPELPLLLKRLRHFCRRNTSDYFIHKDLRGFLQRELEFYIKDQVIHLIDLEADLEAKRRVVRTFRKLAEKIIEFLANIEDVQKTLFEKEKFVLGTDYLIPIQHVPREFWPEIVHNEGQLEEWRAWLALESGKDLFNPAGEVNEAFLESRPTLPVHTKHFDRDFVCRLLEALPFDDLDEATDGLLVHGENYQALRLLLERYREQVKCIYIDPPYNTGSDEFIYKDRYQHSSWLAMMEERLRVAREWMREDGVIFVSIDDNEQRHLKKSIEATFGGSNMITTIPVIMNLKGNQDQFGFAGTHEYAEVAVKNRASAVFGEFPVDEEELEDWEEDEYGYFKKGANLKATGINAPRGKRPNLFYPIYITPNNEISLERTTPEDIELFPITDGQEMSWRWSRERVIREEHNLIIVREGASVQIYKKQRPSLGDVPTRKPKSFFYKPEYSSGNGTTQIKNLFGDKVYPNPKPVDLITDYLIAGVANTLILDFFAGSGTAAHAVINLNRNREDGGRRKFVLVEVAEYFDTVLLPRIAKVMFTPEWKDGKPKRPATPEEAEHTPRLVKILRLESYEDALHNLAAPSTLKRAADREEAYKALAGEDAYRLRYWLELPLRKAGTCLRTLDLAHPFAYSLEILTDDGPVHKAVDLVETFNYLYGLRVRRYETWRNPDNGDREYRVVKATDREGKRRILVLWRDMEGLDPETERHFLERQIPLGANGSSPDWDEILINGDTPTPGVALLDPLFKRLMMEGEGG